MPGDYGVHGAPGQLGLTDGPAKCGQRRIRAVDSYHYPGNIPALRSDMCVP